MTGLTERWMYTEDRKCVLKIRSDGRSDTESRYNFWTAAVVLTGVCIRDGQMGFGEGLGESPVSFQEHDQDIADMSCYCRIERSPDHRDWCCRKPAGARIETMWTVEASRLNYAVPSIVSISVRPQLCCAKGREAVTSHKPPFTNTRSVISIRLPVQQ